MSKAGNKTYFCQHPFAWRDWTLLTREADLQHYSLLPVFDGADGGELVVEQEEEGARQQAHQADEHTVVARVRVLVEDTVETLAAQVNITLVHDGGKHHQGKYLRTGAQQEEEKDEESERWGGGDGIREKERQREILIYKL